MNALTQRENEPIIAFEGFCIAQECALDENNKIDYATIASRLRAIHKKVLTTSEVEEWAYKYNWDFRLKLARAALYEKYKPRFEEQAINLKVRRMSVVNDNIQFLIKACTRLQIKIIEEIDELPVKEAASLFERFMKLTLMLFDIERAESGEQDFRDTSINLNIFMDEAARTRGWSRETAEMMKAKLVERMARFTPPMLAPVSELIDASERKIDEALIEH